MNKDIRVRFAPSPTGKLHVGGARTALFNYLFARHNQGKYLLRIEDTDIQRSTRENVEFILSGLRFLGLDEFDEDTVFQSERIFSHNEAVEYLLEHGFAYRCFCHAEKLSSEREAGINSARGWKYPGYCRRLSPEEIGRNIDSGKPFAVRYKITGDLVTFNDLVKGEIKVNCSEIDDFIIQRAGGTPTYMLAVVVDDRDMGITHVIRGDDHISNTTKQILLFEALGAAVPVYAHVPLILGQDKKRLSKRHGAVSVTEYENVGILGVTLRNFLALLGWSPGDDREIMSEDELIDAFSLDRINKSSAVFDYEKLEWMNFQYLMKLDIDPLCAELKNWYSKYRQSDDPDLGFDEYFINVLILVRSRLRRLSDFFENYMYFFIDPVEYETKAVEKHFKIADIVEKITLIADDLSNIDNFNADNIEEAIRRRAEEWEWSAGKIIHPLRLALTGVSSSPGLFEVIEVLGKETVIKRLRNAVRFIKRL